MSDLDYPKIRIKKVQDSYEQLLKDLGREPLPEEIAADTGMEFEEVRELLKFKIEEEEKEQDFELRYKLTIKNHELEKRRLARNLKQDDLGRKVGISGVYYSQIECCRMYPTDRLKESLSNFFKIPVDILFPEWLKIFSQKWNEAEKSRIVPVSQLSLNSPQVLSLDSGSQHDMERSIDNKIIGKIILEVINELQPREQKVLKMRFGLEDRNSHTLDEVSREFGITRERIRQIEFKAFEKIRNHPKILKLKI